MQHVPVLDELAIVALLAVAVSVVLSRLRLPTVAGLLAAGAFAGPFGLRLVHSVHAIEVLAEIGVVLLLFTVGLEFSLERLRTVFKQVALGGALQVLLTTGAIAAIAWALGQSPRAALFYGFVFALSSTAIVLKALAERRELDAPHGRFVVGTLIFQDLTVIPMVLIVPLLGKNAPSDGVAASISIALGKAVLVVAVVLLASRFVVPRILGWVEAIRSREVFLLAILGLCTGTAWFTASVGVSLALGAFLAGMVVADTEYRHRAMGDVLPLKDAFVSVFFVSLGMLFDPRAVVAAPLLTLGLLAGFLVVKGALAIVSAFAMRFPARVAWLAGAGLAQFGEFGFVLCRLGVEHGVVDEAALKPLLAAGVMSMFLTPLVVRVAPRLRAGERLLAPLERLIGARCIADAESEAELQDHAVLVGYGVAGKMAARSLADAKIPVVVIELNTVNVERARADGFPAYYADATSEEALGHAGLDRARLCVVLINDPAAAERIMAAAKRLAPKLPVLMRTRYVLERDELLRLGAVEVVADEAEGGAAVARHALAALGVAAARVPL